MAVTSALSMAKRSYPMFEVRGSSRKCQATMAQEWQRGAAPRPRTEAVAGRSYPASKVGQPRSHPASEVGAAVGRSHQRPRPGVAAGRSNPCPRPGPAARRSNPRSGGCAGTGEPRGAIPH